MDSLFTIALGLGFRLLVDSINHHNVRLAASLVGLWEGFVVHHYLSSTSSPDPSIAYVFRLVVDYILTRNVMRMMLVLLWTALGMVLSDIIAPSFYVEDYRVPKYKSARAPVRPSERATYSRVRFQPVRPSPHAPLSTSVPRSNPKPAPDVATHIPSPKSPPIPTLPPIINVKYPELAHPEPSISDDPCKLFQRNPSSMPRKEIHDPDTNPPAGTTFPDTPTRSTSSPPIPLESAPALENAVAVHADDAAMKELVVSPTRYPATVALAEDDHQRFMTLDDSKNNTPTMQEIELPSPQVSAATAPDSFVDHHHISLDDLPVTLVGETALSVTPTPTPKPIVTPSEYSNREIQQPLESLVLKKTHHPPLAHTSESVPDKPLPNIPTPDSISIDGSELTVADQESIITAGSRDFVISRADFLRSQAIAEERERDRLNGVMRASFREGRIRDGILLGFDIEEADEKSRRLHAKAARRHFYAHNLALPSQTIDVHRLRVPEAIRETNRALRETLLQGGTQIRVIVGRGNHSRNKIPVLKPAIIAEMRRQEIPHRIDPYNHGILIVEFP